MYFKDYQVIFKMEKGFSKDEKYCVIKDGTKYLLRISKHKTIEQKEEEMTVIKKIEDLDISMCKTIEYGVFDNQVYQVQTWVDGVDLREVINDLDIEDQYRLGYLSGEMLRKIHTIDVHFVCEPWHERYNKKIDKKIKNYMECPLKYEDGDLFLKYLEENRDLLNSRPTTIQHGDFHIGNFMLNEKKELVVIDFEGFSYGDPWEEFDRLVWCTERAPEFAKGMVDGYFNKNVPLEFWKTVCLYISNNIISSLPWAVPFGESQINIMKNLAKNELKWYAQFTRIIPRWYDDKS